MKLRRLLLGRKLMTKLDSILKKHRHYFSDKGSYTQSYGFSSSYLWIWELECWVLKNWWFWTVVLEKTLDSPLDSKEIKPVNPKGNQFWIFIGRTDSEAEAPILWPPDGKSQSWCWERLRASGKRVTEDEMVGWHHRLNGHEFEQTPGDSKGQGILVYCMGLQINRHDYDWTTILMAIINTWMWLALLRTTFQVLEDSQAPNDEFLLSHWWPLPPPIIPVALSPQPSVQTTVQGSRLSLTAVPKNRSVLYIWLIHYLWRKTVFYFQFVTNLYFCKIW